MQKIITKVFGAGEVLRTGAARLLLIRGCSATIGFKAKRNGVAIQPVELKKNDILDLTQFDEVELFNHHKNGVTLEYQLTDLAINTTSDATATQGTVDVNAINKPVVVSSISSPVTIEGNLTAQVEFPELQTVEVSNLPTIQDVNIRNLPDVQKVEVVKEGNNTMNTLPTITFNGNAKSFTANDNRKGLVIVAPSTNASPVTIQGLFTLEAGGYATLPEKAIVSVSGQIGDTIKASEVFYPVDFAICNPVKAASGGASVGSGDVFLPMPNEVGSIVEAFYLSKADGVDTHVKKGGAVDGSLLYETWINFQGVRSIGEVPATEVKDGMSQTIADAMGDPLQGKWRCLSPRVDGTGRFGGMARSFGLFQRIE